MKISFILNNQNIAIEADPRTRVIDILREDVHMTGTKEGCGAGDCGACTILVDGKNMLACLMLAPQLEGRHIITIEGMGTQENMHPLQKAFIEYGAVQCGFCTPGMVMAAAGLLTTNPQPDRTEIQESLSGNLCRCTGYLKIVEAVEEAARKINTRGQDSVQGISFEPLNQLKPFEVEKGKCQTDATAFLPETYDEVWHMLEGKPDALLYAGGTDLLVKLRASHTLHNTALVCLERIEELKNVYESAGQLFIGACCTHSQLLLNPIIQQKFPVLIKALKSLGSPPIRNMGTIGGNICTASPAGDTLPPLYVLDAEVEIRSESQSRRIPIKDFIIGPGKTALKKGEILYGLWLESNNNYNIHHYEKVGQRRSLAISIASLAALLKTNETGIVKKARFAWGSVGPTVVTSEDAEASLIGKPLTEETLKALIPFIEKALTPIDDIRASAAYRRVVAGNLLLRISG
ncbi:MAG: FAD binding domain-containing protein [Proteobacteria bacterium]|nr:FAD binding domain-containing protein [Pseudomonadota bacterium]